MIRYVLRGCVGFALAFLWASAAHAGAIEQACLRSDRAASSPALCACIQGVADGSLGGADQRKIAGFFKDPERAEKARAADGKANDAFWARYESFGSQAELYCGAG